MGRQPIRDRLVRALGEVSLRNTDPNLTMPFAAHTSSSSIVDVEFDWLLVLLEFHVSTKNLERGGSSSTAPSLSNVFFFNFCFQFRFRGLDRRMENETKNSQTDSARPETSTKRANISFHFSKIRQTVGEKKKTNSIKKNSALFW